MSASFTLYMQQWILSKEVPDFDLADQHATEIMAPLFSQLKV